MHVIEQHEAPIHRPAFTSSPVTFASKTAEIKSCSRKKRTLRAAPGRINGQKRILLHSPHLFHLLFAVFCLLFSVFRLEKWRTRILTAKNIRKFPFENVIFINLETMPSFSRLLDLTSLYTANFERNLIQLIWHAIDFVWKWFWKRADRSWAALWEFFTMKKINWEKCQFANVNNNKYNVLN